MRCSTCGETLQPGAVQCPTCGTGTPVGMALTRPMGVRRCPRCSYQGEGIPYFRRGGHIGLLVGVSLFTYGFGGLVYWLARRKHLICPRCGLGWEHASRALAFTGPEPERSAIEAESADEKLPSTGIKRRVLGVTMVLLASLLVLIGFVDWTPAAVVIGAVTGGAGSLAFYWGWRGLQERRMAIMQGLQRKILRLATAKGGTLTVTEVAAEMNLSLPAAEKILTSMDDGFRVRSEISKEGVLYYEFPEVLHRKELGSGR
ncbi:MAG TPA: zinc ribbon domain-containing protein [Longimicrobiales bacterium]|nr:zinc ribbon domain-containing protein [Longimicrobiales bacterium]